MNNNIYPNFCILLLYLFRSFCLKLFSKYNPCIYFHDIISILPYPTFPSVIIIRFKFFEYIRSEHLHYRRTAFHPFKYSHRQFHLIAIRQFNQKRKKEKKEIGRKKGRGRTENSKNNVTQSLSKRASTQQNV